MNFSTLFDFPSLCFACTSIIGGFIAGRGQLLPSLRFARIICIPIGVLGTMIGAILMLSMLSDPKVIGPASAVALLPVLYGLCIAGFFDTLVLRKREVVDVQLLTGRARAFIATVCLYMILAYGSFSTFIDLYSFALVIIFCGLPLKEALID